MLGQFHGYQPLEITRSLNVELPFLAILGPGVSFPWAVVWYWFFLKPSLTRFPVSLPLWKEAGEEGDQGSVSCDLSLALGWMQPFVKKELRGDHLSSGCLSSLAVLTLWAVTTRVSSPWQGWPVRAPTSSLLTPWGCLQSSVAWPVEVSVPSQVSEPSHDCPASWGLENRWVLIRSRPPSRAQIWNVYYKNHC